MAYCAAYGIQSSGVAELQVFRIAGPAAVSAISTKQKQGGENRRFGVLESPAPCLAPGPEGSQSVCELQRFWVLTLAVGNVAGQPASMRSGWSRRPVAALASFSGGPVPCHSIMHEVAQSERGTAPHKQRQRGPGAGSWVPMDTPASGRTDSSCGSTGAQQSIAAESTRCQAPTEPNKGRRTRWAQGLLRRGPMGPTRSLCEVTAKQALWGRQRSCVWGERRGQPKHCPWGALPIGSPYPRPTDRPRPVA